MAASVISSYWRSDRSSPGKVFVWVEESRAGCLLGGLRAAAVRLATGLDCKRQGFGLLVRDWASSAAALVPDQAKPAPTRPHEVAPNRRPATKGAFVRHRAKAVLGRQLDLQGKGTLAQAAVSHLMPKRGVGTCQAHAKHCGMRHCECAGAEQPPGPRTSIFLNAALSSSHVSLSWNTRHDSCSQRCASWLRDASVRGLASIRPWTTFDGRARRGLGRVALAGLARTQ